MADPDAPAWVKSAGSLNGTVHCLAEDRVNNVIYACHYRGMFRSFDDGLSWERAGQFDLPSIAPGGGLLHRHYLSVAVASDGTVFVGNQEGNGQGLQPFFTGMVRMSTDFGDTWQTITPPSTHAHRPEIAKDTTVDAIVVDTENPDLAKRDLVYFCAGNKLYRSHSTDHVVDPAWRNVDPATGNPSGPQPDIRWTQIVPTRVQAGNVTGGLGSEDNRCSDLTIAGGSLFMASTEGVWRSDNYSDQLPAGGPPDPSSIQWTRITDGSPIELVPTASLLLADGKLFVGTGQGAAGSQGVYVSTDPFATAPSFARVQTSNGLAMTRTSSGALVVARSGAGYFSLSRASNPMAPPDTTHALVSLGAASQDLLTLDDGTLLYATDGRGVLRSHDDGATWLASNEGLHHFHQPQAVDAGGRIYAASGKGMAFSDDDGALFANCGQIRHANRDVDRLLFLDVAVTADQGVFAVVAGPGSLSGLWKSGDRCQTWTELIKRSDGGPARQLKVAPNGNLFSVDAANTVIRSTDQGVTWTKTAALPATGAVQSMGVAPNGDIWVLTGWTNASRSTNGGDSWTLIPGSPPAVVQTGAQLGDTFAFVPDGTVYFAAQGGLFELPPGASTFEATGLYGLYGLSSVARDSSGRLYVAVSNVNNRAQMGIYTSTDGEIWIFEPNSIKDRFRLSIWVNPQTDTALISGSGENLHYRRPPAIVPGLVTWAPTTSEFRVDSPDGSSIATEVAAGSPAAIVLTGDVDGDGQDDVVTYEPGTSLWSAVDIDGGALVDELEFGNPNHYNHPLTGDMDGDGDDDLVIWDETLGRFFTTDSDGTGLVGNVRWGNPGQVPMIGDIDGDGRDDFVIWSRTSARWYVKDSNGTTVDIAGLRWGRPGDMPMLGDVDGNGVDDLVYWRPVNGQWFAMAGDGTVLVDAVRWGRYTDTPLIGDVDADGKDDLIYWRPHNQRWFAQSADGEVLLDSIRRGGGSDTPLYVRLTK